MLTKDELDYLLKMLNGEIITAEKYLEDLTAEDKELLGTRVNMVRGWLDGIKTKIRKAMESRYATDDRTIGELFYYLREELADIKLSQSLMLIVDALRDVLKKKASFA